MDLLKLIENIRKEMIELGLNKGLNHQDTIHCSQLLDQLLLSIIKDSKSNIA